MRIGVLALSAVTLLSLVAWGCLYLNSKVDYEPGIDWQRYETFTVERARRLDANSERTAALRELDWVDERTQARITEILERKDIWPAPPAEADLLFRYYLVAREEVHSSDRPGHVRWLREDIREIHYDSYTRGTLVVDVVDREQGLLVWHGAIEGVAKTPETPGATLDRNLERAIDLLLRNQFPPRWPRKTEAAEKEADSE